jgi:hypothetical protein
VAERIGQLVVGRDIRHRIAGGAAGCADPVVAATARAAVAAGP